VKTKLPYDACGVEASLRPRDKKLRFSGCEVFGYFWSDHLYRVRSKLYRRLISYGPTVARLCKVPDV